MKTVLSEFAKLRKRFASNALAEAKEERNGLIRFYHQRPMHYADPLCHQHQKTGA